MPSAKIIVGLVGGGVALAAAVFAAGVCMINNVEQPKYGVLIADGDIEIRDYPALVVAEVETSGDRKSAVSSGFRPLAAYIFAKERTGDSIAMTAPVTQEREIIAMTAPVVQSRVNGQQDGDTWLVRFFMPSRHAFAALPQPASADVRLKHIPATRRVAIRFSGVATDALMSEKEARLRDWLARRGTKSSGSATYAYYNAPFTPGPVRRNEIWLEVRE